MACSMHPPPTWNTHPSLTSMAWPAFIPLLHRFFTYAYDLYMVGVITPMIAFARFSDHVKGGNLGSLPDEYDLVVKGMALVGTLVGQAREYSAAACRGQQSAKTAMPGTQHPAVWQHSRRLWMDRDRPSSLPRMSAQQLCD